MNSTIEILARINENSLKHPDEVFTRLYRYLLREDIYFIAYKNLYANSGAATKGIDDDTADGFSVEYIHSITESLRNGTYQPKPRLELATSTLARWFAEWYVSAKTHTKNLY
jgi:hypothetical protein